MRPLTIKEFMEQPDSEKILFINRYYLTPDKSEYQDFDIGIFTAEDLQFGDKITPMCEMCDILHKKYIGTSDIREPKFCFKHYAETNKDSSFIYNDN